MSHPYFHPYLPMQRLGTEPVPVDHPSHPGLEQRQKQYNKAVQDEADQWGYGEHPVADMLLGHPTQLPERMKAALKRQQRVLVDEPAVPGSERPSAIRLRARKSYKE